jgi:enoyl-CoA hydratase/3-hydroxyacyl-CoA dehydrogenase
MNRPQVLNALSKAMFRDLASALKRASTDPAVYLISLTGSGRAFSAGLDVKEVSGFSSKTEAREFVYSFVKHFWESYLSCQKPIVSLVNGAAYGAGAEIALASDIVLASEKSTFAFSGGRVGALCCISGVIGPLTMNGRKVVEMNLTGKAINAKEAELHGLVNQVAPEDNLENLANEILEEITHVSPISNASFKRIRQSLFTKHSLKIAYDELFRTITSKDFKKGARAFAQKTPVKFYP